MRIYKINVEHEVEGLNYTSFKVSAKSFREAVAKASKRLESGEKIEAVVLLESADE